MAVDAAITNTLYVNWTINAVVLVLASFRAIKLKWRKCVYNRNMKKKVKKKAEKEKKLAEMKNTRFDKAVNLNSSCFVT